MLREAGYRKGISPNKAGHP